MGRRVRYNNETDKNGRLKMAKKEDKWKDWTHEQPFETGYFMIK